MSDIYIPNVKNKIIDFTNYKELITGVKELKFLIDFDKDTSNLFHEIKKALGILESIGVNIIYVETKIKEPYFKLTMSDCKTLEIGLIGEYSIYAAFLSIFKNTKSDVLYEILTNAFKNKNNQELHEIYFMTFKSIKKYKNIRYSDEIILTIFEVVNTLLEKRNCYIELQPVLLEKIK